MSGPWGSVRTEAAVTAEKYHPEFCGVEKLDLRGLIINCSTHSTGNLLRLVVSETVCI